jgi:hypothetical protein
MSANAEQWFDRWELRIADTAAALDYPATPDLAQRLRAERMAAAIASQRRATLTRRAALAMLVLIGLCSSVLIVPPARAAILSFLRIGAVQINLVEPTPTPTSTPIPTRTTPATPLTPTITPRPLGSVLDLGGETTLARARGSVRFPIKLPAYPPDLGQPDAAFVQDLGDQAVMLVWLDPAQPRRVRLALNVLGPNAYVEKMQPRVVTTTVVGGQPAAWAVGEYLLRAGDGDLAPRRLITGNVLIWQEDGITYRLETDLPMDEAVKIGESLR